MRSLTTPKQKDDMNQSYTRAQLESKQRPQLWAICQTLGLPKHASNAKCVEAILAVQPVKVEVKAEITTEEVNDATIVYAGEVAIAAIAHNDDNHLPYAVMVGGIEIHAAATWAACYGFVTWHHKQGTLPIAQPTEIDEQAIPAAHFVNAQCEFNTYIEKQSETVAPTIQVLSQHGDEYLVVNNENGNRYTVRPNHPNLHRRCECLRSWYNGVKCKHQAAVAEYRAAAPIKSTPAKTYTENGYEMAIAAGFTFYQRQCGDALCWIGKKDSYKTIAYPQIEDAVAAALVRVKKEAGNQSVIKVAAAAVVASALALAQFLPSSAIAAGQCRPTSTDPQCKVVPVKKPARPKPVQVTKCDFLRAGTIREGCPKPSAAPTPKPNDGKCPVDRGGSRRDC
jgi:hypothetical protein